MKERKINNVIVVNCLVLCFGVGVVPSLGVVLLCDRSRAASNGANFQWTLTSTSSLGEKGRVKYILRQMNTRWREPLSK